MNGGIKMSDVKVTRLKDLDMVKEMGIITKVKALVTGVEVLLAKNGTNYMSVDIVDKGVKSNIKIFGISDDAVDDKGVETLGIERGCLTLFTCNITEYRGNPQLSYMDSKKLSEEIMEYVDVVDGLDGYIRLIESKIESLAGLMKLVVKGVYDKYKEEFSYYPAARSMHHDILGGLAFHTATMLKSADAISKIYDNIDLDLLSAIIILHDIGKIREYDVIKETGDTSYSVEGSLVGHISIINSEIDVITSKYDLTDGGKLLILALKNGVLSHHGKLEWGSPVKPATAEAIIAHHLDMVDAEMYKFNKEVKGMGAGEVKVSFKGNSDINTYFKYKDGYGKEV